VSVETDEHGHCQQRYVPPSENRSPRGIGV
jgi:hypothetical protein